MYSSFPLNAAKLADNVAAAVWRHLQSLLGSKAIEQFPPILAFQSIVDFTSPASALVDFLEELPRAGHELVLFDFNHSGANVSAPVDSWVRAVGRMFDYSVFEFDVTMVSNERSESPMVVAKTKKAENTGHTERTLDTRSPDNVDSISISASRSCRRTLSMGMHVNLQVPESSSLTCIVRVSKALGLHRQMTR